MGMSASAYLRFGIDLGASEEWYDDDYEPTPKLPYDYANIDLTEHVALRDGFTNPYKLNPYGDGYGPEAERLYNEWQAAHPEWEAIKDEWYRAKRAIEEVMPVEVEHYGHHEYSRFALVLKGDDVDLMAYDYGSRPVSLEKLCVVRDDRERIENAAAFCRAYDLPAFEHPTWLLLASYG